MHFYNFNIDEITRIDFEDFEILFAAMETLEAQKALIDMRIADHPHVKANERNKNRDLFSPIAFPKYLDPVMTMDQMAEKMGMTNGR